MNLDEMRRRATEAKARADGATEGPWVREMCQDVEDLPDDTGTKSDWYEGLHVMTIPSDAEDAPAGEDPVADCFLSNDAAFIAASRTDVPALAADVLALANEVERLRAAPAVAAVDGYAARAFIAGSDPMASPLAAAVALQYISDLCNEVERMRPLVKAEHDPYVEEW